MTSPTSIVLFLAGAGLGAVMCALIYSRLAVAQTAQAVSEAAGKAAANEAGLKAQLEAAEGRTADTAQQLDAGRTTVSLRDQELRLAHADITRHKTEEAGFAVRLEELTRSQTQLKEAFQSLCGEALKNNNEQFLQLARTELERVRITAQAELTEKETAIEG
jgi:DNA recombination protein RmuC